MRQVYIVVGSVQEFPQQDVGATPPTPVLSNSCVRGFESLEDARQFVRDSKLSGPFKDGKFSGEVRYSGGYYEMDIEAVEMENLISY